MLDFELLAYELLRKQLADNIDLVPSLDVGDLDRLPLVEFTITGGAAVNGSVTPPQAWEVTLAVSVFHRTIDDARTLAETVYRLVWSWDDAWSDLGSIPGLGHANEIDDQSIFTRLVTSELPGRSVTQYAGAFSMQMHKA